MKVIIRNPVWRELDLQGQRPVRQLLGELGLDPKSKRAIRGGEMLTRDESVEPASPGEKNSSPISLLK